MPFPPTKGLCIFNLVFSWFFLFFCFFFFIYIPMSGIAGSYGRLPRWY